MKNLWFIRRNGAGKTTLLPNCLNEDILKMMGEVYLLDGEEKKVLTEDIGYVLSTP